MAPEKGRYSGEIMKRLIAIGDIHGCFYTLESLLEKAKWNPKTDTLVFIGDYIDRGKNSLAVVLALIGMQIKHGKEKVVCLRGNHEQMAINAHRKNETDVWFMNGGLETVQSFSERTDCFEKVISWFESLPLYHETENNIFCHAGLSRPKLKENFPAELLWGRNWMEKDSRKREKQVVFGHTPSETGFAYTTLTGDICIDSACVFGGNLCALLIPEHGEKEYVYAPKSSKDSERISAAQPLEYRQRRR